MRLKLQHRLTILSVASIGLFGAALSLMGVRLINRMVLQEAQARVSQDLKSAWDRIDGQAEGISWTLTMAAQRRRLSQAVTAGNLAGLRPELLRLQEEAGLDFLGITDAEGRVLLRTGPESHVGDDLSADPFIGSALEGEPRSGIAELQPERLEREGRGLPLRAFTPFRDTPMARPRPDTALRSGLVLAAAVPIVSGQDRADGVVYAGVLLNRNQALVDSIRDSLAAGIDETGAPDATVTIFQWDVRVATNVLDEQGNRAIGTRVSAEVYDHVLENGRSWYDRAFVVRDWFITAYDPIRDVQNRIVGILYVGIPESRFRAMTRELILSFLVATAAGVILTALLAALLRRRIITPLRRLTQAARNIQAGDWDTLVPVPAQEHELGALSTSFNRMVETLRRRDVDLRQANAELQTRNHELSEMNRDYMEILGFVAHELKNPIAGSIMALMNLERRAGTALDEKSRKLLGNIRSTLGRAGDMIRNYLSLSRIERGALRLQMDDLNITTDVLLPTLDEVNDELGRRHLLVRNKVSPKIHVRGDQGLIHIVFQNLMHNAVTYAREGGAIRLGASDQGEMYEFEVWNEGDGVTEEEAKQLFGKFVRGAAGERMSRRGTGLGLFICKTIVEAHGGQIQVESAPGEWINFRFTLPKEPNR